MRGGRQSFAFPTIAGGPLRGEWLADPDRRWRNERPRGLGDFLHRSAAANPRTSTRRKMVGRSLLGKNLRFGSSTGVQKHAQFGDLVSWPLVGLEHSDVARCQPRNDDAVDFGSGIADKNRVECAAPVNSAVSHQPCATAPGRVHLPTQHGLEDLVGHQRAIEKENHAPIT